MERIDAFTHVMPREFHESMREAHPTPALDLYFEKLWDLDLRIRDMDDHGVEKQVLTLANPPAWLGIDPDDALPLTRLANDLVREAADEYPDRFVPVATLPFATDDYLDEFHRCVEDLGMAGVQIFSNDQGRPIDAPGYLALYEAAESAGAPVWIHPQLHDWYDWAPEHSLHTTFGWPFDTTLAMARLVFAGVFERFPDLDVVTHHLGGMVPYYAGRVATFFEARTNNPDLYPEFEAPDLSTSIEEQFQHFYGDTVIGGAERTLDCGRDFFGDDRVLFATDYPFGPDDGRAFIRQAVDVVETIEEEEGREAVFGGNVAGLV